MSNVLNSSGDKFKNTFTSSNLGKPSVVNLNSTSMFNLGNLTYWPNLLKNSTSLNRYNLISDNLKISNNLSFSLINDYIDYDFKNWQSLELLEDITWDCTYFIVNHGDFLSNTPTLKESQYFNTRDIDFNKDFGSTKFRFNKFYPKVKNME